jgi:multidrug efflux pump subunit AcrA (membrane-fusion protein)
VTDGRARKRIVTRGAIGAEFAEITSGLKAGETVIRAPPESLRDGARVRAAPAKSR